MTRQYQTGVFDVETNGFLAELTVIHCLIIQEFETGQKWVFRRNKHEDTIPEGVRLLERFSTIAGHSILHFDIPAIEKVYPWFAPVGLIRDTLPMARMVFGDQKEKDFVLWKRHRLPGKSIGWHGLDDWGHRLGLFKGDYSAMMTAKGLDPWAEWNLDMEEYCDNDVAITVKLWEHLKTRVYPEDVLSFEHQTHDLAGIMETNGIMLDVVGAELLAESIEKESKELQKVAIKHFGSWYAPFKKRVVKMRWEDPEGKNAEKIYDEPRAEFGEDLSRAVWAEVTVPKNTRKFKEPFRVNKSTGDKSLNSNVTAGAPFTAIKFKTFNPASRDNVVDRFTLVYQWEPLEFTDSGAPSVDDTVLRGLIGHIEMAEELAEIFYLNKRLGQIKTGKNAWLKLVDENGFLHPRLNTGGTISGRCAHSRPNIGQVPRVMVMDVKNKDGTYNKKFIGDDNLPIPACFHEDGTLKKAVILKGRSGRHGWDCRNLFTIPEGFRLVGCDLEGIELRCLANLTCPFDNGYLIDLILDGDIHEANKEAAGLSSRDQAKTFIYALIYGAGAAKIGSIVKPLASTEEQKTIGYELKDKFFKNMPGLAAVVKKISKEASPRNIITGLDGRPLYVRGMHAALNLRLQSDAAVIAKRWLVSAEQAFINAGYEHGWDGDFVFVAFVHDEIQIAVRDELVDFAKKTLVDCALKAGIYYDFRMPTDAKAKDGLTWAETH